MAKQENFKCPNCGGALGFDAESQKLKCPHCDGTFDIDSFEEGKDIEIENETWDEKDNIISFTCKSCGGVIMTDKNTAATSCPYCGNPMVLTGNVEGDYKPVKLIPFKYDKKQAKENYKKFLSGKRLLPKQFLSDAIIDEIKGIYVPYWIFNGTAKASMWFDATKVRTWSDGTFNYRETSIYKLYRAGKINFSNVPVDASKNIPDELTESLEPYDNNEFKNFNSNYLAGYYADKYDVDAKESRKIADSRIANSVVGAVNATAAGFGAIVPTNQSISISDGSQEYVMYPIWLLNIKYDNKMYTFAMNGQTGKFVGNLPEDKAKAFKISLLVFLGVTILVALIQFIMFR